MNRGSILGLRESFQNGTSFNEAPIHESGKSVIPACNDSLAVVASMRPRFMNRGSYVDGWAKSAGPELQ